MRSAAQKIVPVAKNDFQSRDALRERGCQERFDERCEKIRPRIMALMTLVFCGDPELTFTPSWDFKHKFLPRDRQLDGVTRRPFMLNVGICIAAHDAAHMSNILRLQA